MTEVERWERAVERTRERMRKQHISGPLAHWRLQAQLEHLARARSRS